jgi:putative ABC transport system permease protein
VINQITIAWSTVVIIVIGAVIAGFLAAIYPSYKASKMNVLEAIATE